jgi:thioester reductase-like protein
VRRRASIGAMTSRRHDAVLLTGATGFVGTALLTRYLTRTDRHVIALVRAASAADADARLRRVLHDVFPPGLADAHARRCTAVAADLLRPELGLAADDREVLAERASEVVHCAASVSFDLPLPEARQVNAAGARRVGHLADLCAARGEGLRRLVHVSTAYVAGDHAGVFTEDDRRGDGTFRNTYEQTKQEAEELLRAWRPSLPLQVVRPSIVVGERGTGWTRAFNVLYWPLQMFARGRLPVIPAMRDAPVDVVPVDYVADAVLGLERSPAGTYHAVAGEHASTVGEIVAMASRHFGIPEPALVAPGVLQLVPDGAPTDAQRRALAKARVYFPYFSMRVRFDDARARRELAPAGIATERLGAFFGDLMDYAQRADWGRAAVRAPWEEVVAA